MTYHARLSAEGTIALPENLVRSLGMKPGDRVSVDRSGSGIMIRQDDGRSAAITRLRAAMSGYSVERFLAERSADRAE